MPSHKSCSDKYSAYKDSGEYWMGEIPEHWEIMKLKHVFKEKKKVTNPSLNCGSISFGKVVYKDDEKIPESTKASYQEVLAGEYLVNPLNLNYDLISLRIGLSSINVVVSSGYIVLKNAMELDKSYFNYLLHRYDVAYMKLLGSGVRQTISFNHIANSLLAYPPIEEQTAIANFLDDKTAKIDRAIGQKEQLIALLKERKQIIIQNAVTGKWSMINGEWSMTPKEKMKDSGVEWIGEIPEGWEVKRFKYLFAQSRLPVSSDNQIVTAYRDGQVTLRSNRRLTGYTEAILEAGFQGVRKGQLVLNSMDAFEGAIGVSESEGKCTPEYVVCDSINQGANNTYFALLLREMALAKYIQVICNAVRQRAVRIRFNNLAGRFIVVPPQKEQTSIVAHIETQSAKIDQTISLQQTQIEKLKEYKATMIDSVVTGKIKVS